jgi:hypothetical protein
MRTIKDTMTIKEMKSALASLECSFALTEECRQAAKNAHMFINVYMRIVELTGTEDISELNDSAVALHQELGKLRELVQ